MLSAKFQDNGDTAGLQTAGCEDVSIPLAGLFRSSAHSHAPRTAFWTKKAVAQLPTNVAPIKTASIEDKPRFLSSTFMATASRSPMHLKLIAKPWTTECIGINTTSN
jgi:hypothetical protein